MSSSPQPRLRFERHECKYLISEQTAREVHRRVQPYVIPDPHAARDPEHSYTISSLYLDSPRRSLLSETLEGIASRYKLRIRSYTEDVSVPIFPEIKLRRGAVIHKLRSRIAREDLADFLAGRDTPYPGSRPAEVAAGADFRFRMQSLGAVPTVQVGCVRQAYMGEVDRGHRVTFDRRIAAAPGRGAELGLPNRSWRSVEGKKVVLELKFDSRAPFWMTDTVRQLGLRRVSYSKYANSYATCADVLRHASGL